MPVCPLCRNYLREPQGNLYVCTSCRSEFLLENGKWKMQKSHKISTHNIMKGLVVPGLLLALIVKEPTILRPFYPDGLLFFGMILVFGPLLVDISDWLQKKIVLYSLLKAAFKGKLNRYDSGSLFYFYISMTYLVCGAVMLIIYGAQQ